MGLPNPDTLGIILKNKPSLRELGMDIYTLLYLKPIINKNLLIAYGTLFNVMWHPGWEESLGENGYMYMYG